MRSRDAAKIESVTAVVSIYTNELARLKSKRKKDVVNTTLRRSELLLSPSRGRPSPGWTLA